MEAIHADPQVLGGIPCFTGARVPVSSLGDYLAKGYNMDYFLSQFPTVTREQAQQVLRATRREGSTAQ